MNILKIRSFYTKLSIFIMFFSFAENKFFACDACARDCDNSWNQMTPCQKTCCKIGVGSCAVGLAVLVAGASGTQFFCPNAAKPLAQGFAIASGSCAAVLGGPFLVHPRGAVECCICLASSTQSCYVNAIGVPAFLMGGPISRGSFRMQPVIVSLQRTAPRVPILVPESQMGMSLVPSHPRTLAGAILDGTVTRPDQVTKYGRASNT